MNQQVPSNIYVNDGQYMNPKCITANELLSLFSKTQINKQRLLKQLQQLDINIGPLKTLTLQQIYLQVQPILRNTYSIKYLGLNKNQMGIVSKRIDPTKPIQSILNQQPILTYTINKYFYPKPLKVGRKPPKQDAINLGNLEKEIKKGFQTKGKPQIFDANNNLPNNNKNLPNKQKNLPNNKKLSNKENQNKCQKMNTKIGGSWLSIGKIKNTIYNQKKKSIKNVQHVFLPESIPIQQNKVNSYANFLAKGIILVKDC